MPANFTTSGRAPFGLTLELLASEGFNQSRPLPAKHAHTVTVPGAAASWVDTVETLGSGKVCCSPPENLINAHVSGVIVSSGVDDMRYYYMCAWKAEGLRHALMHLHSAECYQLISAPRPQYMCSAFRLGSFITYKTSEHY